MRQWERSSAAIAEIFAPFQYLTRTAIQDLVDRARTLQRRIGGNFQLDPKGRREHEEHEALKRMLKATRDDLTAVEDQLDTHRLVRDRLERDQLDEHRHDRHQLDELPQPSRPMFYSHPSAPNSYLSKSGSLRSEDRSLRSHNPYHPSNEILQLRGENSDYRDENLALREELDEKEAIIRSLRDRVAILEGEVEDGESADGEGGKERGDDEDVDWVEGGLIRGAKRRKL
jgi:hypothetical protein